MTDDVQPTTETPEQPTSYTLDQAADKFNELLAPPTPAAETPAPTPEVKADPAPEPVAPPVTPPVTPTPQPPAPDAALLEHQQQLQQAIAAYTQELARMQQQQQPDWAKLAAEDPAAYVRLRHEFEQRQAALTQAQQQQQALEAQQRQHFDQELAQLIEQQQQALFKALPEWQDQAVQQEEVKALNAFLTQMGYPSDVVGTLQDHREVLIARKAMLYDKMMADQTAAKDAVAKKLENLPPRVERPGTAGTNNANVVAINRLAKTGSLDDAAVVFAQMLAN